MVAAARKHNRVVQVGTQRRSTPHLDRGPRPDRPRGQARQDRPRRDLLLLPHAGNATNPPDTAPPENLDYEMWTGPAPMRPYNPIVHPRGWRAFMEYGNGIMGDMCIHMLDMVRWMLDLGWPRRIASTGGILSTRRARPTSPTRRRRRSTSATWTWSGSIAPGAAEPDPKYPWGATIYGDKGTLKASVDGYDFIPQGGGTPIHQDVTYELEQYPEDKTEKDLERHVAPAIRRHMLDFLTAIGSRGKPVADIEEGHISTASCILANLAHAARPDPDLGRREGPGRRRRRGEPPLAPALSRHLGSIPPPGACE